MIACISPIEYNVVETINTLKYASRARSIKNTSKVNAVEAGWDDVEHLQATVLKLRKQAAALETDEGRGFENSGRGNEKLIQRLADLQREHTEVSAGGFNLHTGATLAEVCSSTIAIWPNAAKACA